MNRKVVLVVDEDSHRVENLLFIVRLGGYVTRTFSSTAAALNWIKYGCTEDDALCLLFNNPGDFNLAEEIVAAWTAAGMTLPIVLLQRGKGNWNRLLAIGEKDHFFVSEPESVMQTLEILTAITANSRRSEPECSMVKTIVRGVGGCSMLARGAENVYLKLYWRGVLTQAMSLDLGGELLTALKACEALTVNLDGVELLDFSCFVLLCAVKRQANEKGKILALEGLENPRLAEVVQRYCNGNRLCRAYCGQSCLFEN